MPQESSDVSFRFSPRSYGYAARAARGAVLYPWLREVPQSQETLVAGIEALQRRWRRRLKQLARHGWQPPGRDQGEYARNCQPAFLLAQPRTRYCRLECLCPFCYARMVGNFWRSLATAFPSLQSLREAPYHLIERRTKAVYPWLPASPQLQTLYCTPESWVLGLMCRVPQLRTEKMHEFQKQGVCGGLGLTTVSASRDGWRFVNRQLLQIPADARFEDTTGEWQRHAWPTRQVLLSTLCRVFRYPQGWLRGDAAMTAALLTARSTTKIGTDVYRCPRLLATYGSFRRARNANH